MHNGDHSIDEIDRMISKRLANVDRIIEKKLGSEGLHDKQSGSRIIPRDAKRSFLSALPPPELCSVDRLVGDLTMTDETLRQTAAFVFYSPHVQTNALYKSMASATVFSPDLERPEVNAFASNGDREGMQSSPLIVVLGGAATLVHVAALAIAVDGVNGKGSHVLRDFVKSMGRRLCVGRGEFSPAMAAETVHEIGLDRYRGDLSIARKAQSYAVGMMAQVIGHELGHIALAHTLGASANLEVSRNQEREADLFASSVISTSPFGEYLIAGPVVWELIWVWCEHAGNQRISTTHPLSRERLLDFIRSNKEQAAAIGISESTLRDFLPPGK